MHENILSETFAIAMNSDILSLIGNMAQHVGQLHDLFIADGLPLNLGGQVGNTVRPVTFLMEPVNYLLYSVSGPDNQGYRLLPFSIDTSLFDTYFSLCHIPLRYL